MNTTIVALINLALSVPDWINRLNELNGQIALRQIELARLTDSRPPTARSVRNKGSTESLRPRDGDENIFFSNDPENERTVESPRPLQNGFASSSSVPRRSSPAARARAAGATTPPPPRANSNPRPSPNGLNRHASQPKPPPTQLRPNGPALRKRKTESLASGESLVPKYRTRSMIIVYYDSAVQTAFEELVKFVSGSRNTMRKGKMAAKMAEMRRAAELEVELDGDEDMEEDSTSAAPMSQKLVASPNKLDAGTEEAKNSLQPDTTPKLQFVSTRQMHLARDYGRPKPANNGSTLSFGLLRGYRRSGVDGAGPDVFDELDKALEWCQSECEKAAHQFLRDGECGAEIEGIKKKLHEVKAGAEKETEKQKALEIVNAALPQLTPVPRDTGKPLQHKNVTMRRPDVGKDLEVDNSLNMEVDEDEGIDDLEPPPKLMFKRSKDVAKSSILSEGGFGGGL